MRCSSVVPIQPRKDIKTPSLVPDKYFVLVKILISYSVAAVV